MLKWSEYSFRSCAYNPIKSAIQQLYFSYERVDLDKSRRHESSCSCLLGCFYIMWLFVLEQFFRLTIYGTLTVGSSRWGWAENHAKFPNLAELPTLQTGNSISIIGKVILPWVIDFLAKVRFRSTRLKDCDALWPRMKKKAFDLEVTCLLFLMFG